jgi:mxaD protein
MHVSVIGTLNAPAHVVWARVGDFGTLHTYQPGIVNCTLDGEGIGSVRTLHFADGRQLRERLEQLDTVAHTMMFTFADTDIPFQDYHCTVQVEDLGDGRSEISWSSVCEPQIPEETARQPLEAAYRAGLGALQEQLGA